MVLTEIRKMSVPLISDQSLVTCTYFSDAPPYKMNLILDGLALAIQGERQGIYLLSEGSKVNGYEHWYQQDGLNGVWFGLTRVCWTVGPIGFLGQDYGGIIGPDGQYEVKWPTEISVGYRFHANSIWNPATSHEVVFIECKYLW